MKQHLSKRILVYSYILTCIFVNLAGAEETNKVLVLEDALAYAYKNNPNILIARKNIDIALAEYKKSKKFLNPELEFELSKVPSDLGGNQVINSDVIEGEIKFTQPFQIWGKRKLSIGIADDEKKQVEYEFRILWLDIARRIKEQYAQTLLYQKSIDLAMGNLERAQRLFEQTNIKFNSGKARNHELSRSRLEVANARNYLLEAESNFNISLGRLNVLLGRGMGEDIRLEDNLTPKGLQHNLDELIQAALETRSDILDRKQEVIKKEKELSLSKRRRLPDINIGLFLEREEEIYNAGAGISFEFPFWNQFQDDIKKAEIEKEISEMSLGALKKEVELDVYTAFKNVDLAKRAVSNLEQAIKEANELLRIITIEYEEGEASFLVYLEGLTSYKETKQNYLQSLVNYINKLAVLEQSVGKVLKKEENQK